MLKKHFSKAITLPPPSRTTLQHICKFQCHLLVLTHSCNIIQKSPLAVSFFRVNSASA